MCREIPLLNIRTRVCLVMHHNEADKPTNTGRLATLVLQNSELRVRGVQGRRMSTDGLDQGVVLYPDDSATLLNKAPAVLVVPDATWNQAARIVKREPVLNALPRVHLGDVHPAAQQVRNSTRAGGLSTLEAIAEAMGRIGETHARAELLRIFALFVQRTLRARSGML